jgi:hypothetical protein
MQIAEVIFVTLSCEPPGEGAHFIARESENMRDTRSFCFASAGREASPSRIETSLTS